MLIQTLLAATAAIAPGPQASDIVLIILDDVAVQDMENVDTPIIDSLAANGVTFDSAYANPTCSPTRRAIMFGKFTGADASLGCNDPDPMDPPASLVSLPQILQLQGYETSLFGKWHLGAHPTTPAWQFAPQARGFDIWRACMPSNVNRCGGTNYNNWRRVDDGSTNIASAHNSLAIRNTFLNYWQQPSRLPRFAMVSFQAPHAPFHNPPASITPVQYQNQTTATGRYHAMLASADLVIGEMLAELDRDTWVIVIGDNGTPGMIADDAKTTTYERGIHVPLIVSHFTLGGSVSSDLIHAVDLMGTIAELAGAELPTGQQLDTRSFAPSLTGQPGFKRSFVFCQVDNFQDMCLRTRTHKLRIKAGAEELFDMLADPDESAPLDLTDPANLRIRDRYMARITQLLERQ